MTPAQQSFKAGDAILAKIEKRLINEKQFVPFYRCFQINLQRAALARRCVVARLKEADRARAGFLRAIQRDIGTLENIVWRFAVAGRQTYADAGSADDLVSLNQERIFETGDNLLGNFKYLI